MNPPRPAGLPTLDRLREAATCNRRLVSEAREHVGAAGLEQSATLERIITAGREHETLNAALREVLATLQAAGEADHTHEIDELVQLASDQMEIARQFRTVVEDALARVTDTPVTDISVTRLETIRQGVESQARDLQLLIDAARRTVTGPERQALGALQREVGETVQALREQEEAAHVDALGAVGHEVIDRIAAQAQAPTRQQVEALEQVALSALARARELRDTEEVE